MKHLNVLLNEAKKQDNQSAEFWYDLEKVIQTMIKEDDFYAFWSLKEKYPEFTKAFQEFDDKFIVPLHNKNKVRKSISYDEKIIMYIKEIAGFGKSKIMLKDMSTYPTFKEWFENGKMTIYRGVPLYKDHWSDEPESNMSIQANRENIKRMEENLNIETNVFKSFTLDMQIATSFTQIGWAQKAWINKKERNGWIFVGEIKPCDVHIFQNEGGESECVIKGPFTCTGYYDVIESKVKELKLLQV